LLASTVQSRMLTQFTVGEGFEANRGGVGTMQVGFDGSLLLNRAQWAAYHQSGRGLNMQAGENLPLQILFFQVCRLVALPIIPVVVFDGPDRPALKREARVKVAPHALQLAYVQLLTAMGFSAYA
ncbi:hypothetical protein DXG01_015551, partial [Tephrocybe rancida]